MKNDTKLPLVPSETTRKISRANLLAVTVLVILTFVFYSPILISDKTFYAFDNIHLFHPWSSSNPGFLPQNTLITDPVNQNHPFYHLVKTCFEKGSLPFWNPYNFSGLQVPQGGISKLSNPIVLLSLFFLPTCTAHDFILWIHLAGCGIFMFLYLRRIELQLFSSLLGAVSWMFNGYVMVWFEFEIVVIMAFSLPASFFFIESWFKEKKFILLIGLAFSIGIAIGSGFAHLIIYQFLFSLAYLLKCIVCYRRQGYILSRKNIQQFIAFLIIVTLISSLFVTAHLSTLDRSQRKAFTFNELYDHTGKLPLKYLGTLIYPDLYGNPVDHIAFTPRDKKSQIYNNYNELCIYIGIIPLIFALFSLVSLFRNRFISFYSLSSIIVLSMAMGSIIYYPLATFVPGLNFSTPTRLLFLFGFSMSALTALGFDEFSKNHEKDKIWMLSTICLLLVLALGLYLYIQVPSGKSWLTGVEDIRAFPAFFSKVKNYLLPNSSVLINQLILLSAASVLILSTFIKKANYPKICVQFLIVLLTCYDLVTFGMKYNTAASKSLAFPETESIRFLKKDSSKFRIATFGNFFHNSFSMFGIHDIGGYESFYPKRYGEFIHLSQYGTKVPIPHHFNRWMQFNRFMSPLLDLINTKYLLFPPAVAIKHPALKLVYDREIRIYENLNALPMALWTSDFRMVPTRNQAYRLISNYQTKDFLKHVILEKNGTQIPFSETELVKRSTAQISWKSHLPDSVELEIQTKSNGFLVLADGFHPGWKAFVDDKPTPIYRANYIMKAVPVKAGKHRVSMFFRPTNLLIGSWMTFFGWVLLAVTAVAFILKERRFTSNEASSV